MVGLSEIEAIGIIAYFDNTHSGRLHYPEKAFEILNVIQLHATGLAL